MSGKMVLEKVDENVLRLSGDVSLSDVYASFPDHELFVEPLSSKMPISEFISRGGFGYGALREGPLNSKIFRIKWKRPKYSFGYGLKNSALYAAGYPLQRMVAVLPHELYNKSLGEIQEIVVPVREEREVNLPAHRAGHQKNSICRIGGDPQTPSHSSPCTARGILADLVKAVYEPKGEADFSVPPMASNVLFANGKAASILGLPGKGTVVTYPQNATCESAGGDAGEFLQKRFIEDSLTDEDQVSRILTQKSGAAKIYELVGEDGLFFALSINIGLLVIASGDGIEEHIAEIPLTYGL